MATSIAPAAKPRTASPSPSARAEPASDGTIRASANHSDETTVTGFDPYREISHPATGMDTMEPAAMPSKERPRPPVESPSARCTAGIRDTHVANTAPWMKKIPSVLSRA